MALVGLEGIGTNKREKSFRSVRTVVFLDANSTSSTTVAARGDGTTQTDDRLLLLLQLLMLLRRAAVAIGAAIDDCGLPAGLSNNFTWDDSRGDGVVGLELPGVELDAESENESGVGITVTLLFSKGNPVLWPSLESSLWKICQLFWKCFCEVESYNEIQWSISPTL